MLVAQFGPEAGELPGLAWAEVGREVYLSQARRFTDAHGEILEDATVGDLGDLTREERLEHIGAQLRQRLDDVPAEGGPALAVTLLGDALTTALARDGWEIEAALGEPVLIRRSEDCLEPYAIVPELGESPAAADGWRERSGALGIAGLRLFVTTE